MQKDNSLKLVKVMNYQQYWQMIKIIRQNIKKVSYQYFLHKKIKNIVTNLIQDIII